jgi:hypothetical protein
MQGNRRFREVFQELSSYTKESTKNQGGVKTGNQRERLVVPVYELAAKYSFLKGVINAPTSQNREDGSLPAIEAVLNKIYVLYLSYPDLFTMMSDFSTRYTFDENYQRLIKKVNADLEEADQNTYAG